MKVDIFSWSGVETLVRRMNTSLVESILDCDCTACQWLHFLENIKTVERRARVISDMELFSAKGVSPTGNEPPKSLRECGSKAVLFAMLCYLGTPFMIYFDIWENSSRDPGKIGLMRFRLDKRLVFECFLRLYELQEIAEGGFSGSANQKHTLINERTNKFIEAFQQVERQFQPLQLSPRIQSLTVPNGTVFPFHDFRYQQHGGQAGIYVIKVLGEFREGLMKGHSTDDDTFICKVIERGHGAGQECMVGEAADHEKYGMSRMKKLDHPNLIQMHLWFDFLDTRVFLLPCYHGDLDELLRGEFDHRDFNPPQPLSPDVIGSTSYSFPTEGWLWKGMLGILDGLTRFHGSAANQGVQATHLDLKPSNILISRAGEMVISDCGTSRVTHEYRTRLTTHRFIGTTAYSPPWTERDARFSHPQPKLNQSFDVWSMACILLEVLIFIIQDAGGIKRFRAAKKETNMDGISDIMNSESSRSTFWYFESREQNTAKLKGVVAEWLDRADAMAQLTEDNTGTLSRLTARLRIMFKFGPIERGTIEACSRHLRGDLVATSRPTSQLSLEMPNVSTGFGFISRTYTEQDLKAMIDIVHESNSSLFGGDELGYIDGLNQACRGIPRTLSNLPLTYLRGHAREECPCRVRIFENDQILTISIAFVLRGRIFLENITLQRKLDSLAQRNLFDVHRHRLGSVMETCVIWSFTGLHQTQLFKTRDLTSFMAIQEVLLGQEYIPGSHSQLKVCVLQPRASLPGVCKAAAITVYFARVEVWIEVPESQKPCLKRVGTQKSTDTLSAVSSYRSLGETPSQYSSEPQTMNSVSGAELGHNPRLVIYRRHETTGKNDCITMKLRGKCIILREKSDIVVSIVPKHSYIQYHIIPLGTDQKPNGLSLNTTVGSDRIEVGEASKAELINLQFFDRKSLQQFKESFKKRSFLRDYFAD